MDCPSLPLSPEWRERLGALPATFGMLVYGPAGSGKSTWMLQFADELARHAPVLFVASEEGQANSMIEKLARMEIRSDRVFISSAITVPEMLADLDKVHGCRFLILDSLSFFPLDAVGLSQIAEERRLGVCFSLHCTKSGQYRGPTVMGHWCDVIVRIEDGTATLEKSRFGPLKSWPLTFAGPEGDSP
jgi:predicted ATP-dependent serine protease